MREMRPAAVSRLTVADATKVFTVSALSVVTAAISPWTAADKRLVIRAAFAVDGYHWGVTTYGRHEVADSSCAVFTVFRD